jgi:drug/metabolite transporter (DMT)-like permease
MLMQTARRSSEKKASKGINSMAMSWLQQAAAIPFIIFSLLFAKFYFPTELSADFWKLMTLYVALSSLDLYLYFKALSIADISFVAPLMTLFAVGNLAGAYLVLGQTPTLLGAVGALLIMTGAYIINYAKKRQSNQVKSNRTALFLILGVVVLRSFYANIEVFMLRESNPTTFNFYSSMLTIPLVILVSTLIIRSRPESYQKYWHNLGAGIKLFIWPLIIVGLTYTLNMLATYQAKTISPNAAYVGAVKSAAVLPVTLIGILYFKEKVVRLQWAGLTIIVIGLALVGINR